MSVVSAQMAPEDRGYNLGFLRRAANTVGPRCENALLAFAASMSGAPRFAVTVVPPFTSFHVKQLPPSAASASTSGLRSQQAAKHLPPPSVLEEEQESNVN
jgi:hypothetical protein